MAFMSFISERPHNTLSVFDEGAIEHILGAKVWLYGFHSFLLQVFTDFLFVVCLLFFLHKKIEYQEFLIPLYRRIGNCKPMGHLVDS